MSLAEISSVGPPTTVVVAVAVASGTEGVRPRRLPPRNYKAKTQLPTRAVPFQDKSKVTSILLGIPSRISFFVAKKHSRSILQKITAPEGARFPVGRLVGPPMNSGATT